MLVVVVTSGAILGVTGSRAEAALGAGPTPPVPYNAASGQHLVSEARQIMQGQSPWTGGCVPGAAAHCVPYSWGGGHGPQPGPTDGICQGWSRASAAPKTLFAGPACAATVTKAHPYGYGDNGKYGLDCSGYVRWVYFLVYGRDVLGPGTTAAQQSQPVLANVPAAQRQPGDLVFFSGHVGIYAGNGTMLDEPHTYDPPATPSGHWTQVYARIDPVGSQVLGYYRIVIPGTGTAPAPTSTQLPTPKPRPSVPVPSPTSVWPTGFPGDGNPD